MDLALELSCLAWLERIDSRYRLSWQSTLPATTLKLNQGIRREARHVLWPHTAEMRGTEATDSSALGWLLGWPGAEPRWVSQPVSPIYGNEAIDTALETRAWRKGTGGEDGRSAADDRPPVRSEGWNGAENQGRQVREARLKRYGWSVEHGGVIARSRICDGIVREHGFDGARQPRMDPYRSEHEGEQIWGYAVVVTNAGCPFDAIGQQHCDRADTDNACGELKTPCGQGGFTTQNLARRETRVRARAPACNGWVWRYRAAHRTGRREAVTARAMRLASGGRNVSHSSQTRPHRVRLHGRCAADVADCQHPDGHVARSNHCGAIRLDRSPDHARAFRGRAHRPPIGRLQARRTLPASD